MWRRRIQQRDSGVQDSFYRRGYDLVDRERAAIAELSTLRWYAIPDRESMYAQSVLCTTGEPAVPSPIVLVLSGT